MTMTERSSYWHVVSTLFPFSIVSAYELTPSLWFYTSQDFCILVFL